MSKNLVAAGFMIFRKVQGTIEYLILQTSYGTNHWTPPKGHVDPGESEWEAAVRETKEEAGISCDQLNVFNAFKRELNYEVKGRGKKVVYWLAEVKDTNTPVILSEEHIEMKWANLSDACKLLEFEDITQLYKDAEEFINANRNS